MRIPRVWIVDIITLERTILNHSVLCKSAPNFVTEWPKFGSTMQAHIMHDFLTVCKSLQQFKCLNCSILLKKSTNAKVCNAASFFHFWFRFLSQTVHSWGKRLKWAYWNARERKFMKDLVWRSWTVLICRINTSTYRDANLWILNVKLLRKLLLAVFSSV